MRCVSQGSEGAPNLNIYGGSIKAWCRDWNIEESTIPPFVYENSSDMKRACVADYQRSGRKGERGRVMYALNTKKERECIDAMVTCLRARGTPTTARVREQGPPSSCLAADGPCEEPLTANCRSGQLAPHRGQANRPAVRNAH